MKDLFAFIVWTLIRVDIREAEPRSSAESAVSNPSEKGG